jgi:phospholipase A1
MAPSSRFRMLVPLALALACPAAALAADALARCAAIDDDAERLACHDELSGRAPATSTGPVGVPGGETPEPQAEAAPPSLLGAAWMLDPSPEERELNIRLYRPNYLLVARYSDRVNDQPFSPAFATAAVPSQQLDDVEAKFQLSFKARLWHTVDRRWAVWLAYTQQSQWQVYNGAQSRPFRETDYQPELFVTYDPELEWHGFRWRLLNVGYAHQSNGRSAPLSRSWDRIFAEVGVERGEFALLARVWYRIPESSSKDDNPDITDYLGYGEVTALYKWRGHTFTLYGRGNLSTGKGAGQLTWSSPRLFGSPLRLYAQLFTGYGESLIDYNWNQTTIGAGIALNDLL